MHGPVFVHRRDVDDPAAAALLDHLFGRNLGPEKGALQIDIQHLLVLLFGGLEHGGTRFNSGVVHHDVQPPKRFHGGGYKPLQVRDFADIRFHPNGFIAKQRHLPFDRVGRLRMGDIVDCDVRSLPGQFEHNRLTDSAVATGDNGDFVFQ